MCCTFSVVGFSSSPPVLKTHTSSIVHAVIGQQLLMQCTFVFYSGIFFTFWIDESGYSLKMIDKSPFCVRMFLWRNWAWCKINPATTSCLFIYYTFCAIHTQVNDTDRLCLQSDEHVQSYRLYDFHSCLIKTEVTIYLVMNNVTESDAGFYSCKAQSVGFLFDMPTTEEKIQVLPGEYQLYFLIFVIQALTSTGYWQHLLHSQLQFVP